MTRTEWFGTIAAMTAMAWMISIVHPWWVAWSYFGAGLTLVIVIATIGGRLDLAKAAGRAQELKTEEQGEGRRRGLFY